MNTNPTERRARIYAIMPEEIVGLLAGWKRHNYISLPVMEIPQDATIAGVEWNFRRQVFDVVVESASFEVVALGAEIPRAYDNCRMMETVDMRSVRDTAAIQTEVECIEYHVRKDPACFKRVASLFSELRRLLGMPPSGDAPKPIGVALEDIPRGGSGLVCLDSDIVPNVEFTIQASAPGWSEIPGDWAKRVVGNAAKHLIDAAVEQVVGEGPRLDPEFPPEHVKSAPRAEAPAKTEPPARRKGGWEFLGAP